METETLVYLIQTKASLEAIRGFPLQGQERHLINGHFADNYLLAICEDPTSCVTTLERVDIFCTESGSNI